MARTRSGLTVDQVVTLLRGLASGERFDGLSPLGGPMRGVMAGAVAHFEQLAGEVGKQAAKANLWQHAYRCEQCRGPDDGCDDGQTLEQACFDLGIDPHDSGEGSDAG